MSSKIDYWFFENYLTKNEIIMLNKFIENNFDREQPKKHIPKGVTSTSKVLQIEYYKIKDKLNFLIQAAYNTGLKEFGYNLTPINDLEYFNLNIYSSKNKGEYQSHYDASNSDMYDIKLTLLINISLKKYKGGELEYLNVDWKKMKQLDKPGNLVIFKSHFHHKVSPIISGERRTLAHFMSGPKFS